MTGKNGMEEPAVKKDLSAAYAYIDEIREETLGLYREFVNRESWSKTPDKVRIFSDFLKAEMEKAGFECRYVRWASTPTRWSASWARTARASRSSSGGHMDTVFPTACTRKTPSRSSTARPTVPASST